MTVNINGQDFEAVGSVLDAVLASGTEIPHLCKDDNLAAIGACRTCLVDVDGRIVASCSFPASAAKTVQTHTDRVIALRRGVLELTAAMQLPMEPGALSGPFARTAGEAYAAAVVRPEPFDIWTAPTHDASSEFIDFHEDQCILCGRCVVACQDLQHIGAIGMAGGGRNTRVTPDAGATFRQSTCTSCGSCVAACPTFALRPKVGGTN